MNTRIIKINEKVIAALLKKGLTAIEIQELLDAACFNGEQKAVFDTYSKIDNLEAQRYFAAMWLADLVKKEMEIEIDVPDNEFCYFV